MKTLFLASSLTALAMAAPAMADDWGYSGETGPDNWGGVCTTGVEQSPIDIANAIPSEVAVPTVDWSGATSAGLVNNGHTLQVNFSGDGHMHLNGTQYNLLQLHFHSPSEHTVTGESFPLEVHFVHASEDGALAVIGVFFEEGDANAALTPIWGVAPAEAGEVGYDMAVDFDAMMPTDSTAYRYAGSLTTPPCSEIVAWTVMDQPVTASAEQIETFVSLFGNNARPTLPVNRRYVLTTG